MRDGKLGVNGRVVEVRHELTSTPHDRITDLVLPPRFSYALPGFGRVENRFLRSDPGEEESPNSAGRDAA
jgi:hypothetical protein